jgi:SAM-dependent MidA family methyltransferase
MCCEDVIIKRIKETGPLSFRDFMEMALYYPELGYYTSGRDKIGCHGDYYTSSYITPLFGEMIGRQLEEMWRLMGEKPFTIVEYGAGMGVLSSHILQYIRKNPVFYKKVHYCIIEKSAAMRQKQKAILPQEVCSYASAADIPPIDGCILSNELVDNFAVHQVIMCDELMEVFVDYDAVNGFVEMLRPAPRVLKDYLMQMQVTLPRGYRTEINIQAQDWLKEVAGILNSGFVLTIDYGFSSAELYNEKRSSGTLLCYYKHRVNDDFYHHIGEQDITAHVNFSALHQWGLRYGLSSCGYTNQGAFLHALGLVDCLRKKEKGDDAAFTTDLPNLLRMQTLLTDMGGKLKVLIQQKGLGVKHLSGLKFAQRSV